MMFWTLMRKDLRLLRTGLIFAIVVDVVMYGIAWPSVYYSDGRKLFLSPLVYVPGIMMVSLVLTAPMAAVFGGAALTTERSERWSDFASVLPVQRKQMIASRWLSGALLALVTFGLHAVIFGVWVAYKNLHPEVEYGLRNVAPPDRQTLEFLEGIGCAAVGMFGIAWLLSAFLRSPAITVGAAVGIALGGLLLTLWVVSGWHTNEGPYVQAYVGWLAAAGVVTMAAGSVWMARRAEP